jgi:hypothetical protein
VEAKVLARRGDYASAEWLASEAVQVLGEADAPLMRADALIDLAEVLTQRNPAEARAALERALELCRLKAMVVPTARTETLLKPFEAAAAPAPRAVAGS